MFLFLYSIVILVTIVVLIYHTRNVLYIQNELGYKDEFHRKVVSGKYHKERIRSQHKK